jgi:hypothetical protein
MKTTIEIKGYEIVIEETEEGVSVMAVLDGETVEEFTLEPEVGVQDDEDMEPFGGREEEEDFDGADEYEDEMDELGQDDEEGEEDDDMEDMGGFGDEEDEDEDEEEEEVPARKPAQMPAEAAPKMESFGDFVRRTNRKERSGRK